MYSDGPPHMTEQKQDDQLEHTYSNYVRIRDIALKTCRRRWTIGRIGEKGSGISLLAARHEDDDDIYLLIHLHIYANQLFPFSHSFYQCLVYITLSLSLSLSLSCTHTHTHTQSFSVAFNLSDCFTFFLSFFLSFFFQIPNYDTVLFVNMIFIKFILLIWFKFQSVSASYVAESRTEKP